MGKIVEGVKKAFSDFKDGLENQVEQKECIKGLCCALINIADHSIHSETHRGILDEAVNSEFAEL